MKKQTKASSGLLMPIIILIGVCAFAIYQFSSRKIDVAKDENIDAECTSRAYGEIGGPFELIDTEGKKFSEQNLLGANNLIYFGYTYCPDICPNSLTFMGKTLDELKAQNPQVYAKTRPILITFDPERDTKERLKEYITTPGFPTGLIGLTGTLEQTKSAAKAYKVAYKKNENPQDKTAYTVDHSSIIYLVGVDGKLKSFFSDNTEPKKIAACIAKLGDK